MLAPRSALPRVPIRPLLILTLVWLSLSAVSVDLPASVEPFREPSSQEPPPIKVEATISEVVEGIQGGSAPWLLGSLALTHWAAGQESRRARSLALLESLTGGCLPWKTTVAGAGGGATAPRWFEPGIYSLDHGGVRGTLAALPPNRGSSGARLVLGMRGEGGRPVISGQAIVLDGSLKALSGSLEVTFAESGAADPAVSSVSMRTLPHDPLMWSSTLGLEGTVLAAVVSSDGRTGDLTLQFGRQGLGVRGAWPASGGLREEIQMQRGRFVVRGVGNAPAQERLLEIPVDGSGPIQGRSVHYGPGGTARVQLSFELAARTGLAGSWEDLAARPPRAGTFRVVAGDLVMSDQNGVLARFPWRVRGDASGRAISLVGP